MLTGNELPGRADDRLMDDVRPRQCGRQTAILCGDDFDHQRDIVRPDLL